MIITKIRLQEEHPMTVSGVSWPLTQIDLDLNPFAGDNGYKIMAVQGLDPPDLISIVEGFDSNGVPIFDNVASDKSLTFKIELKPGIGQSYGSLRDDLYKYVGRSICISLMNGSIIVGQTTGYINRFESDVFSNKPNVIINVECFSEDFYSPYPVSIPLSELPTHALFQEKLRQEPDRHYHQHDAPLLARVV